MVTEVMEVDEIPKPERMEQCQEVQVLKELKAAPIFKGNKDGLTKEFQRGEGRVIRKLGDGPVTEAPGKEYYKKKERVESGVKCCPEVT